MGAIHSTKIPTGQTGKSGPPQKVDPFFETFPVGPNRSIEFWTEIFGNFGWMDRALCIGLQFHRRVRKDVTGRETWKILETRDKGYHDCPLSPSVSVKFYKEEKRRSSSEGNWRWPRPTWTFATWTGACVCMFSSINCEINDFESLKQ